MTTEYLPVFVYGTLRNGHGNYSNILEGNTVREEKASMNGKLFMVGGFPGMIQDNESRVVGELMYIDPKKYEEVMKRLDWLEGYRKNDKSSMYIRKQVMVWNGSVGITAWTYYWNRSTLRLPLIENGDFNDYQQKNSYSKNRLF